jgi:hypothetical protein
MDPIFFRLVIKYTTDSKGNLFATHIHNCIPPADLVETLKERVMMIQFGLAETHGEKMMDSRRSKFIVSTKFLYVGRVSDKMLRFKGIYPIGTDFLMRPSHCDIDSIMRKCFRRPIHEIPEIPEAIIEGNNIIELRQSDDSSALRPIPVDIRDTGLKVVDDSYMRDVQKMSSFWFNYLNWYIRTNQLQIDSDRVILSTPVGRVYGITRHRCVIDETIISEDPVLTQRHIHSNLRVLSDTEFVDKVKELKIFFSGFGDSDSYISYYMNYQGIKPML